MRPDVKSPEDEQQAGLKKEGLQPPLYLSQFQVEAGWIHLVGTGPQAVRFHGEILIAGRWSLERFRGEIRRFTLWSEALPELGGTLSLADRLDGTQFQLAQGTEVKRDVRFRLYYPLLSRLGPAYREHDAVFPQLETWGGTLKLSGLYKSGSGSEMTIVATLTLKEAETEADPPLKILAGVEVGPATLTFRRLRAGLVTAPKPHSLSPCSGNPPPATPGNSYDRRALHVRFVNVSDQYKPDKLKPDKLNEFVGMVQEWVNSAGQVWWEKAGVQIVPKGDIDSGSYHNGKIPKDEEAGITVVGQDECRVDVYLVDELYYEHGGGLALACGTDGAYILLEIERAKHNKYLLAHELGHVLGLCHPDASLTQEQIAQGLPKIGSYCSVMLADPPISRRNTENNIEVIETSAYPVTSKVFKSLGQKGGWNPDAEEGFFHFIRAFPYDDGTRFCATDSPSWGLLSDVWNSDKQPAGYTSVTYVGGVPMFNSDHSPVHTEPRRNQTNYLCVRLHTGQPLVRPTGESEDWPVNVYLYLAVPGKDLMPLKGVNGPHLPFSYQNTYKNVHSFPRPGFPRTRWVEWNVPADLPDQCCVFAVAVSNYQPPAQAIVPIINDPTRHTYENLFDLLQSCNDVAQRCLQIQL